MDTLYLVQYDTSNLNFKHNEKYLEDSRKKVTFGIANDIDLECQELKNVHINVVYIAELHECRRTNELIAKYD